MSTSLLACSIEETEHGLGGLEVLGTTEKLYCQDPLKFRKALKVKMKLANSQRLGKYNVNAGKES